MSFKPKNILLPLSLDPEDEIDLASYAADVAIDIAEKFGASLKLIHMASISMPSNLGVDASGKIYETLSTVLRERTEKAKAKMADLEKRVREKNVKVTSSVVDISESVAHAICELAEEEKMDLIVIGSHSRRGLKKLLLGSVAEKVVHLSKVPVMLLPTKQK